MALSVGQGKFTATTSGTSQSVTGLGFKPKAIIFFAVSATATSGTGVVSTGLSAGFTDGTHHFCSSWIGASAVSTTALNKIFSTTRYIDLLSTIGAVIAGATSITLDSDGFTITWSGTPVAAYEIYYLAFGDQDITVVVGNHAMPTVTGTNAVTGLGFKPSIVFLLSSSLVTTDSVNSAGGMSFGCAVSTSARWATASAVANGATMSSTVHGNSIQQSAACLQGLTTAGVSEYLADLSSMDSGGFTLNFTAAPASAYLYGYLAISGGQWDCGTSVSPGSATTQTVSGEAFQPAGLLLAMAGLTTLNTITANAINAIGLAISSSSRSEIGIFHNSLINTVERTVNETTEVLRDPNTTTNVADFTSFNSGGWTITWAADTVAYQVAWVAMASVPGIAAEDDSFAQYQPAPRDDIVSVWG